MARRADTNDRPTPQSSSETEITICSSSVKILININDAAARIVGMDISIEKRAAAVLEKPNPLAAVIVIPDLLVPGINARIWAKPMINAWPYFKSGILK